MSMVVAHNMSAINTKRQFSTSARGMSGAMEKLSSGYKINAGKDDPSGLVISEKLRSQINGLQRAQQNTEEVINVMGIAEGALNEMNNILKKMKALAIHSSNTGVTSAEQIAADQAEMDSSIQTLDRIAQTTKFSNDNLLNGAKDITYTAKTEIKGTQQNSLVSTRDSTFSQIFKRDDYSVAISFTGSNAASELTGIGDVDFSQQAMKAYMEVDTSRDLDNTAQIKDGKFTQDQSFILTGSKGSRAFNFAKGQSVATMVGQIKSAADSTGIDAALVFNSDQQIDMTTKGMPQTGEYTDAKFKIDGIKNSAGEDVVFNLEPTEEMQAQMDLMPNGMEFGITVDNAGITALTVNGTAVTSYWDGTASGLQSALFANGSDLSKALADSLTMSGDIDMNASEVDAEYSFGTIAAASLGNIRIDNIFGDPAPDGTVNGSLAVNLAGVGAIDLNTVYADLSDSQKASFVKDAQEGNMRVEASLVGNQGNMNLKISLVGDNGTYATQLMPPTAYNADGTPNFGTAATAAAGSGIFAGATATMTNMTTTTVGFQAGDAVNRNAGSVGVDIKVTKEYNAGTFSDASATLAVSEAAAPLVTAAGFTTTNNAFTFGVTDSKVKTAANDDLKITITNPTTGGVDTSASGALFGKNFTLKLKMNEGDPKGQETYSLIATVGGDDYTIISDWNGTNADLGRISSNTVTGGTGYDASIADELAKLKFGSNGPIDVATSNLPASNTNPIFDYTDVSDRLTTDVMTIATGLYNANDPTQGVVEIQFDNFDMTDVLASITDDDVKARLNAALASGEAKLNAFVSQPATPDGSWTINLSITDKDGNNIVGLGAFSSTDANLTGAANKNTDGETVGGWKALDGTAGSGTLAGLKVRITNSLHKADYGFQGSGAYGSNQVKVPTNTDVDANPQLVSAESATYSLLGFSAASASTQVGGTAIDNSAARQKGSVAIFNNGLQKDADGVTDGTVEKGVTSIDISDDGAASVQLGKNTDGQGRIYVKFIDDQSYELYKDASMSKASLVATGVSGQEINQANNSGLEGFTLNLTGNELTKQKGVYFTLAGIEGTSETTDPNGNPIYGVTYTRDVAGPASGEAMFEEEKTLITGVELGTNTDVDGKIYTKAVYDHENGTVQVSAYKDSRMRAEDLVAESDVMSITDAKSVTIVLNEKRNADLTAGTGLGLVFSTENMDQWLSNAKKDMVISGEIAFNNLGARIFSQDYGSDAMVKVTQDKGSIFSYYGSAGQNTSKTMVDADSENNTVC